jgi:hypothetical protein
MLPVAHNTKISGRYNPNKAACKTMLTRGGDFYLFLYKLSSYVSLGRGISNLLFRVSTIQSVTKSGIQNTDTRHIQPAIQGIGGFRIQTGRKHRDARIQRKNTLSPCSLFHLLARVQAAGKAAGMKKIRKNTVRF